MQRLTMAIDSTSETPSATLQFYRDILHALSVSSRPYLVGGAYAFNYYTGVNRQTRDFDIFIARSDYDHISRVLSKAGYRTELTYPHWLGKVHLNGDAIDLIFSSGNGVSEVDAEWFEHSTEAEVLGVSTRLCPVEEMLWSKAFIMERERFDGADVAHLLLAQGERLDWLRLLRRFGAHWRLLLTHLTLFGFIYPMKRSLIPSWVMETLLERLKAEMQSPDSEKNVCGGTLLSREQYLDDIERWGYQDARTTAPGATMSEQDTVTWTEAIEKK